VTEVIDALPPTETPDRGFSVSVGGFEGPFDLLLQLISKHKLEVTELALHVVTDEFIAYIRQEFPCIPIVYKLGNHEERWTHWLWQHAAEISDDPRMSLGAWLDVDKHGVELVEDQRPIMLGKLPVLHGHELPRGIAAPVNVARGAWMRTLSTCLVGHSHRTSNHAESDMWHHETATWSTGCLCDLRPDFSRINRWNWGFAVCTVHERGAFDVNNYRVMGDGTVRSA